jgi:hypothetical protein
MSRHVGTLRIPFIFACESARPGADQCARAEEVVQDAWRAVFAGIGGRVGRLGGPRAVARAMDIARTEIVVF